jgi:hypothetical protein
MKMKSQVFPYEQIDRQTDITKLVVAFRNFSNVSNSEQLHVFTPPPSIIRRMKWVGHVPLMEQQRNAQNILVGRLEGRRPLQRPRRRWKDNIHMGVK